jgi:cation transport ATPase
VFKGAAYIEGMAAIKAVAFDKTGTLTQGKPAVTDVVAYEPLNENELLVIAASVESRSEHPLAKGCRQCGSKARPDSFNVSDFQAVPGRGVEAILDHQVVNYRQSPLSTAKWRFSARV